MDTTTGIAIFGVAATLFSIGIAVWLAIRRRYPGQITYFEESCIGLFDSIVRNLPDLKVLYKSDPVSENIVLLKGYIMNTGSKDITKEMVDEPLTLRLPEGFKWLDANVIQSETNVKASLNIKEATRAEFDLGLFRVNEYIKFEALAEVPTLEPLNEHGSNESASGRLENAFVVSHRLADTQKVISGKLPLPLSFRDVIIIVSLLTFLTLFIIFSGMTVFHVGGLFSEKELHYLLEVQPSDTVEVKIDVAHDGTLSVQGVDKPLKKELSVSDFFAECNFKPKVGEQRRKFGFSVFLLVVFLLFLLVNFSILKQYKKTRRVRRLLSLE